MIESSRHELQIGHPVRTSFWVFLVSFTLLILSRWGSVSYPEILNPDEAQFAACAVTAVSSPLPYLQWDPTTSGPLNIYPLMWPAVGGQVITIKTGRVTAVAAIAVTASMLFLACALAGGFLAGAIAGSSFTLVHIFVFAPDFTHFSSEMVPNAFLAAGVATAITATGSGKRPYLTGLSGLFLSCAPLAKLQTGPMAVFLFLIVAVLLLWKPGALRCRFSRFFALCVGGAVMPVALTLSLMLTGAWTYFVEAVVKASIGYAGQTNPDSGDRLKLAWQLLVANPELVAFLQYWVIVAAAFTVAGIVFAVLRGLKDSLRRIPNTLIAVCGLAIAWTMIAIWTLLTTGRDFPHYLLFLLPPMCLSLGALTAVMLRFADDRLSMGARVLTVGMCILGAVPFLGLPENPFRVTPRSAPPLQTVALLQAIRVSSERLSVWGWMFEVHPMTNMPIAFKNWPTSINRGIPFDATEQASELYLSALRESKVEWFFESIGAGVEMTAGLAPADKAVTSQPAVAEEILSRYELVAETDEGRLHARKDVAERWRGRMPASRSFLGALRTGFSLPPAQYRRYPTEDAWFLALPGKVLFIIPVPLGADSLSLRLARPPAALRWNTHWIRDAKPPDTFQILAAVGDQITSRIAAFATAGITGEEVAAKVPPGTEYVVFVGDPEAPPSTIPIVIGLGELRFFEGGRQLDTPFSPSLPQHGG